MPKLRAPRPHRPGRPSRRAANGVARIVVLGDLMLDVVLAPGGPLERGTDVPGRVSFVQGGSAANTARWLARLGARTTLIAASVPELTNRIRSIEGIRRRTRSASSISRGLGAPKLVPFRAVRATVWTRPFGAWPWMSGPHDIT